MIFLICNNLQISIILCEIQPFGKKRKFFSPNLITELQRSNMIKAKKEIKEDDVVGLKTCRKRFLGTLFYLY